MSEPARTPEKPASKAEDFIDVYVSPAELFRRRVDGKFGHALIVLPPGARPRWRPSRDGRRGR